MDIIGFLKKGISVRLSYGDRWMYWDEEEGGWIVREHKPYSRVSTVLSATTNEEEAISKLIEGHEEEF